MMFELQKVIKKLQRIYDSGEFFKSYIQNTSLFPLELPLKKLKQKDIQHNFDKVQEELKKLKKYPFELVFEEFRFKTIGWQKLPTKTVIKNESHFLEIVQKQKEFEKFKKDFEFIILKYPALSEFFLQKPLLVLDYQQKWQKILKIVQYFLNNKKHIYIREICIDDIDTKFIENHKKILDLLISFLLKNEPLKTLSEYSFEKKYGLKYPQAQIRFRLDKKFFGFEDLSLVLDEFKSIRAEFKQVFVIENKTTFLSFPLFKDTIVIFGEGYGISKLKDIKWLKDKRIFYWGDIDIDGFAILSQFRGYYPQVESLLMDIKTFTKYKKFATFYTHTKNIATLNNLTKEEKNMYDILCLENGIRLEQEQIPIHIHITILKSS